MQKAKPFEILTDDKIPIQATCYGQRERCPHLVIVAPATAAPQPYYRRFAEYVSSYAEFDVVTFDYRTIGASMREPVAMSSAKMSDWGEYDLKAVIDWADEKYDKIFLVGHSVAGQIFPKAENHNRISAAYFVGSQSVYFGHWRGISLLLIMIFWFINVPLATFIFGYLPGWAMGGKISIGSKIAREWRRWALHPNGVIQGDENLAAQFSSVKSHIHFVNIQDDRVLAPVKATQALMHYYKNAITTYQYIRPADLGLKKIGHFGFFKKPAKKLWSMPVFFFTQFIKALSQE